MNLHIVFDDSLPVSGYLGDIVRVDRFGDITYARTTLRERMQACAHRAGFTWSVLSSSSQRDEFCTRIQESAGDDLFLVCPSDVTFVSDPEDIRVFLDQVRYSPTEIFVPAEGGRYRTGWYLVRRGILLELLKNTGKGHRQNTLRQGGASVAIIEDRLRLVDISEPQVLLEFLSGQFDVRHFNEMSFSKYTVTKRSRNHDKIRREYSYYQLVPPRMQSFLVQPYDLEITKEYTSYKMERLAVPDASLLWVMGSFRQREFDLFLERMFHFFASRPSRATAATNARAVQESLYVQKVRDRIAQLKAHQRYPEINNILQGICGGIDALLDRYLTAWERVRERMPRDRLVIGHGDPCLSNVLYSKTGQFLRLIDPRGAETEDELYTDPCYDVAKLAHSVLGNYDFINHQLFSIHMDGNLRATLHLDRIAQDWAAPLFRDALERNGFDLELIRVCEASLFVSMLPLHIDFPRKVVAFAINASAILDSSRA